MPEATSLVRALGVSDLTWLYLVAVVNLNIIPVVATEGLRGVWLWIAVLLCFFLPQGIAVIEMADRMPGEGGLYLWTKQSYGDFHGFLCGWCYWMTNIFFVPTLLFYMTGITAYLGRGAGAGLSSSRVFFLILTLSLLWLTIFANIRGLGIGKWVNNIGGIGVLTIASLLFLLAAISLLTHPRPDHLIHLSGEGPIPLSTFGVMCLAMVGLEIGPVMGDEIRDARRTIPRGVLLGGGLCALIYLGSTACLLIAVPKSELTVLEGILQALDKMSGALRMGWIVLPMAVMMAASIVGSTSAWVSGSARILFVCGIDRYLPKSLGNIHPRYGSPYVALSLFGFLASGVIVMSFIGASVKEAYLTLIDLSVALQMISYLYLFLSFLRRALSKGTASRYFSMAVLRVSACVGVLTTLFGFAMAFVPSRHIESIWSFEMKMVLTLALFLGVAWALFSYYSGEKNTIFPPRIV